MDRDLANPVPAEEAAKHKLKRLVQEPDSYYMDVKCPSCMEITAIFSHTQTVVTCAKCTAVMCTPTGGKTKLVEGVRFRRKAP